VTRAATAAGARVRTRARLAAAGMLVFASVGAASPLDLPRSAIAVDRGGDWREWWQSERAPVRWSAASPVVIDAIEWRHASPGVEWGEMRLAGSGEAWRVRVIVARIDPRQVHFSLTPVDAARTGSPAWSVSRAPEWAAVALNAGQFASGRTWGWLVRDGREVQPPGTGPLAPAIVIDSAGGVHIVPPDSVAAWREGGAAVTAVQSYPALLVGDGEVPFPLRAAGLGVDVHHRDARLAFGVMRDGRVLVALTRFEGLRGALSVLPFGFTTPEMAAIMGALGARRAVLLDGGISGQLRVRERDGTVREWDALRKVPLGLLVAPR
jgi:hypothetical protein